MKKKSIKETDYQKYYRQLILKKIGVVGQKKIFEVLNKIKISSKIKLTIDVDPINFS